jgi:hypothetical protein
MFAGRYIIDSVSQSQFKTVFNNDLYSYCQHNIPFQPPDNFVSVGKNSQTKARKREQGHGVLEYRVVV